MKFNGILSVLSIIGMGGSWVGASELGLYVDRATVGDATVQRGALNNYARVDLSTTSFGGFGVRGAFTVLDLQAVNLGVTADFHFKGESETRIGSLQPSFKSKHEYLSLGAQAEWTALVDVTCGLELRMEKTTTDQPQLIFEERYLQERVYTLNAESGSSTFARPWLKAGLGYTFPLEMLSPFVRLEAAYALKTYSLPLQGGNGDDLRRALSPKAQFILYAGVKF